MQTSEINYEIIKHLHPYYAFPLYASSKQKQQQFEVYKYNIIQRWIMPSSSVQEIKMLLPTISYSDIVELALFYCPISESIGKFDKCSLYYNAMKLGYENPLFMFDNETLLSSDFNVLSWICYKFNRYDVLIKLHSKCQLDRKEFDAVEYVLMKKENPSRPLTITDRNLARIINNFYDSSFDILTYILTEQEFLELLIIIFVLIPESSKLCLNYVRIANMTFSKSELPVNKQYIESLINKYADNPDVAKSLLLNSQVTRFMRENPRDNSNLSLYQYPELILQKSKEDQLVYYLQRGDYISYMRLRNEGVEVVISENTIRGINPLGLSTFNRQLIEKLREFEVNSDIDDIKTSNYANSLDLSLKFASVNLLRMNTQTRYKYSIWRSGMIFGCRLILQ